MPEKTPHLAADLYARLGRYVRRRIRDAVRHVIAQLSEQDQHAIETIDLQGMSQTDYAASLGLDYTTAKSRIQHARKGLRREFDRCCEIVLDRRGAPIEGTPSRQSACCETC